MVSALGWSLVQRSPTECCVFECDCKASVIRTLCPTRRCCDMGEKIFRYVKATLVSMNSHGRWIPFLDPSARLWKVTISFVKTWLSVCPSSWNNSAPNRRTFVKFGMWEFFDSPPISFAFHYIETRIASNFHDISLNFYSNGKCFIKSCRENQNTHFIFDNFSPKLRAFYEIMWENMVQPGRSQLTIYV